MTARRILVGLTAAILVAVGYWLYRDHEAARLEVSSLTAQLAAAKQAAADGRREADAAIRRSDQAKGGEKTVRRIGTLTAGSTAGLPPSLLEGLRELGWIEGKNLVIDRRTGDGHAERVPALAAELVQAQVEVIVTFGAVAGVAAKNATNTIPIVATTGDPVAFGLVSNMSHPGGNITGIGTRRSRASGKASRAPAGTVTVRDSHRRAR